MSNITRQQLIASLREQVRAIENEAGQKKLKPIPEGYLDLKDWQAIVGLGENRTRHRLAAYEEQGRIKRAEFPAMRADGSVYAKPYWKMMA